MLNMLEVAPKYLTKSGPEKDTTTIFRIVELKVYQAKMT
jgi:hypothetical protein